MWQGEGGKLQKILDLHFVKDNFGQNSTEPFERKLLLHPLTNPHTTIVTLHLNFPCYD